MPRAGPPPPFAQAMTPPGTGHGVDTQAYVQKSRQYGPPTSAGARRTACPPTSRNAGGGAISAAKARSQGLQAWPKISLPLPHDKTVPHPGVCRKSNPARGLSQQEDR